MAGVPGRLGIGVAVSMALEAWMALRIARLVGIKIDKPTDIFSYLGAFAIVIGTIGWGFVHVLRFVFSLFVLIPGVPATFVSEIIVTNFTGVIFWVGFEEARSNGSFTIPKRMMGRVRRQTSELVHHQVKAIKGTLNKRNIKVVGKRIRAWLTGDMVLPKYAPAEVFLVGAITALGNGDFGKLDGPLGQIFLQSIRDRWSRDLSEASVAEIADKMATYDADQMVGVMNVIKGKMFEHLVALHENTDGDKWVAALHDDESYPGSDIVFTDLESGQNIEVSLKAVSNPDIIEAALLKYPDIPILTTSEMEGAFSGIDMVSFTEIEHDELADNADELFDEMMKTTSETASRTETMLGVAGGTAAGSVIQLWPYTAAYLRRRISKENLNIAFTTILGDEGLKLAGRVAMAAVFGPIYAWYLLARGVVGMTMGDEQSETDIDNQLSVTKRLDYRPRTAFTI